jgi:hypothetical protein
MMNKTCQEYSISYFRPVVFRKCGLQNSARLPGMWGDQRILKYLSRRGDMS